MRYAPTKTKKEIIMKVIVINNQNYNFKLSLRQSELLGPIMSDLIRECPEALSGQNEIIANVKEKFETIGGSKEQKEIMSAVQDEVVTMFQNIVKLKLRTWLQKNKYISRMLATLLVPDGDKFREETIDERTAFFANVIDLDNDTDASMVEEVIDHFFMRSGVSGTITPQSSVSLKKT
jgi:hypothetical protein